MNYRLRCVCCKYCGVTNDEFDSPPKLGRVGDKYRVIFTIQDFSSLPVFPEYQRRVRFIPQDFSSMPLLLEYQYSHLYSPGFSQSSSTT